MKRQTNKTLVFFHNSHKSHYTHILCKTSSIQGARNRKTCVKKEQLMALTGVFVRQKQKEIDMSLSLSLKNDYVHYTWHFTSQNNLNCQNLNKIILKQPHFYQYVVMYLFVIRLGISLKGMILAI